MSDDSLNLKQLKAPWDRVTVILLNTRQQMRWLNEYTCQNGCQLKGNYDGITQRLALIATPEGWICPGCLYAQDWAHAMDLDIALAAIVRGAIPDAT